MDTPCGDGCHHACGAAADDHKINISGSAFLEQFLETFSVFLCTGKGFIGIHTAVDPAWVVLDVLAVVADLCGQGVQHGVFAV